MKKIIFADFNFQGQAEMYTNNTWPFYINYNYIFYTESGLMWSLIMLLFGYCDQSDPSFNNYQWHT